MSEHEHHGMKPLAGLARYCRQSHHSEPRVDRFGRMFPHLPPSYVSRPKLVDLGKPGGPMDAGSSKKSTSSVPVGMVFFGQFVDHDITLDASTSFEQVVDDAGEVMNVRTPTLDLDCIYGLGPEAQPYLYSQTAPFAGAKLLTGADTGAGGLVDDDLLRSANGRAMIGDPRNDENRIISQMQLAMVRFHNHVCDTLNAAQPTLQNSKLYEEARKQTTWHYQWNVVHDFLTTMCGAAVVDRILACGREYYCGGVPYIPVEFSVAAYRFGHSMIPMQIQTQKNGAKHDLFGSVLGDGFKALTNPAAVVDFHELFETPENRSVERADKLD
ncbi:MAG TPA: peroxidase family protein, partial [Longimicrobiales bacterium]|nr:peroxidase family protein [Longimicrobiales bacterium]